MTKKIVLLADRSAKGQTHPLPSSWTEFFPKKYNFVNPGTNLKSSKSTIFFILKVRELIGTFLAKVS